MYRRYPVILALAVLFFSMSQGIPSYAQDSCTGAAAGPVGTWKTSKGAMSFPAAPGGQIRAIYSQDNGRIIGSMLGQSLVGVWVAESSARQCPAAKDGSRHWGRIVFNFNSTFTDFKGLWSYCGDDPKNSWTGTKDCSASIKEATVAELEPSGKDAVSKKFEASEEEDLFSGLPADISLELTYPAGKSPKVFTKGWVFGAKAVVNPGESDEKDISNMVRWSGTGKFDPAQGTISRPSFYGEGKNTIKLEVTLDGESYERNFSVNAVSPRGYARVSDQAFAPSDGHGHPSEPHSVIGPIIVGSPNVNIGGLPAARKGDTGVHAACSGSNTFKIVEGDEEVLIDGKPAARMEDKTQHCGGMGEIVTAAGYDEQYFVVFQMIIPTVKEDRKPKRREGEDDDAWEQRRRAAYENMAYGDFYFKEQDMKQQPFVIRISDEGLQKYEMGLFEKDSQWTSQVKFSGTGEDGNRIQIDGALLLTAQGEYPTMEILKSFYPSLKDKEDLKIYEFDHTAGTAVMSEQNMSITLGPITPKWNQKDKEDAVKLAKSILILYDCFIAHVVYDDLDAYKINIFREFRDKVLQKSKAGEHLTRLYYEYGPYYALRLKDNPAIVSFVRLYLDIAADYFETIDFDDPGTAAQLNKGIYWVDAVISNFYKEGESKGLGQLTRIFVPLLWSQPE